MNPNTICRIAPDGNGVHYQVIDDAPIKGERSEQDLKEFEELCRPVVEYIQKKWHPHTRIIIDWDRASIFTEECSIPFQVPDSATQRKKVVTADGEFDEEYLNKWRRVLKSICPPEFLQELQRQAPYLKFDEYDTPNPAHLRNVTGEVREQGALTRDDLTSDA